MEIVLTALADSQTHRGALYACTVHVGNRMAWQLWKGSPNNGDNLKITNSVSEARLGHDTSSTGIQVTVVFTLESLLGHMVYKAEDINLSGG